MWPQAAAAMLPSPGRDHGPDSARAKAEDGEPVKFAPPSGRPPRSADLIAAFVSIGGEKVAIIGGERYPAEPAPHGRQ